VGAAYCLSRRANHSPLATRLAGIMKG